MPSKLPRFLLTDPFLVPPTPEEQKALTPEQLTLSLRAIGMLPQVISNLLGNPDHRYFFQRIHGKLRLVLYVPSSSPPSEAELCAQQNFLDALAAWGALSPSQKNIWNTDPRRHRFRLPGYHFFIKLFLLSTPLPELISLFELDSLLDLIPFLNPLPAAGLLELDQDGDLIPSLLKNSIDKFFLYDINGDIMPR